MWIYLKCEDSTSSAVLPALPWHCETTLAQSPIAKSTPIAKASSCKECRKGICPKHRFGMIYEPSQVKESGKPFPWMLTSSTAASRDRAKIFLVQELETAWQESEAGYFSRSCAWPKKSSPSSYSLRTYQLFQPEADFRLLVKLPRWGMIVAGVLYPLHPLERYTSVKDGSCWPTPKARDYRDLGETPGDRRRNSPSLPCVVKTLATPTASQANKPIRAPSPTRSNGSHGEDLQDSIGRLNPEMIGKKLSVEWVNVLMGYPPKWSSLNVLEIQ